jgi:SAM-dependent methyltransferase
LSDKTYDRDYFDRWYRGRERVRTAASLARKAALALAVADQLLGRRARTVLDVGCGEGAWRAPLLRLRPGLRYLGVDASEYAVARYGASRRILLSSFAGLGKLGLGSAGPYDLVVCSDILHYLGASELARGLPALAALTGGVAYVDLFTSEDTLEGDLAGWNRRPSRWYRERLSRVGLVPCGLGFWAGADLASLLSAMERPGPAPGPRKA